MRKVTISEVALVAGVSRATADRVLNRRGGVSVDKERAVLVAARTLGLDRNLEAIPARMLRVCVLMKPPQNPFYKRLTRGFREANLLFTAQAITAYIAHIDVLAPETIQHRLREMTSTYDGLVIVAPAHEGILEALRSIAQRIPVVTLATDLPFDAGHYYVGPNNYKSGRLAGELTGRMLGPGGGKVLLVAGLDEFSGHGERRRGFLDVLAADFPNCRVAAEINSLDVGGMAAEGVVIALKNNPDIGSVYNISQGNDEIALRLKKAGKPRKFVFVCHDLTTITKRLLLSREIDAVIDQDPPLEARRALEIILGHYGRLPGRVIDGATPLSVFFRENVDGELL